MCGWGPYAREASVWEACCWYSGVINMFLNCLMVSTRACTRWWRAQRGSGLPCRCVRPCMHAAECLWNVGNWPDCFVEAKSKNSGVENVACRAHMSMFAGAGAGSMVYGPTLGAPIECHRGAGERVVGEWVEVVCSGASGFSRPASDASSGPAAAAAGADPPAAAARSARSLSFATSFSAATPTPAITFSSTPQPAIVYRLMHGGDSDQRVPWRHGSDNAG